MRIDNCLRNISLFLALATPALLGAQFQAPADDELKMTADPKAPEAAAVYLYREETTDDSKHFHSYYVRIKVLTEKGKELATVRTPYEHGEFTVTDIQGRTIHADGTVIPLTAKPSDLTDFKTKGFQVNTMVFTLPSVEVGSILEYRLKLRYGDEIVSSPTWEIQQPYFIHKAHYFFRPSTRGITDFHGNDLPWLMYSSRVTSGVNVVHDNQNNYSLDLTDIPAVPDEDWMPPMNTLKWRVEFYYTKFSSGAAFWEDAGKGWGKEVEGFIKPTPGVTRAAAGMVGPADSEQQKAEKIYAAVMKLENTAFTRKKSEAERKKEKIKEIHSSEDVWLQDGGSDDDLALLYVALARAAGLKAWPMEVVDRSKAIFDNRYLSTRQLNDFIAIVSIDGKEVYLDPGQKMCTFGALHWKHAYASGFRLSDKGVIPGLTPPGNYKMAVVEREADLTIDEQGGVTGIVRFVMTGPDALHWRQLTLEDDPEEVKKRFNESMQGEIPEGVQADFDHFLGLEDYNTNLIGIVKVSGNLGTATGKHFFLPGLFFESRAKHPFTSEDKRTTPIDVHYPKMEQDDATYRLPAGFTAESTPQAANANWPDHAMFKIVSTATGGAVTVHRTLAYNFTLLDPKEYPNLHDFYQKAAAADQQQLVLTRAPAAKGN
jgi:hypothetical protein